MLRLGRFFSSISVYLFMAFGIVLSFYISTLFLARYAQQAKEWRAYHRFVGGARWTGPLSLLLGVCAFFVPTPNGLHLIQNGLKNPLFEPFLIVSLITFLLGYTGILTNKQGEEISSRRALWQLGFGVAQVIASQLAYAIAHAPYLLYPFVTIESSATNRSMFLSTLLVLFFGLVVLSPLLLWFRRLFITDAEYVATHIREPH
ncbi:cytochrome d ubiquinol oxidase subunit II [Alicyclobacillus fastidiosus]|uniref:cytochrome d ubiquinol oxidase subunit II n=1 Tax=Alicyclobacillus fastidiosus TaxID=392011 RepID=UPI0032AF8A97